MKAAFYVRVSTPDQAEKWSLPAQQRALVEFAERQGWEYEVYEDAGISGETLDARPAMLRLLEDARAGRIQVAVAVEMERFSRSESLFDWLVIKQAFRQGNVRFGTPQQLFDPVDAEDDFSRTCSVRSPSARNARSWSVAGAADWKQHGRGDSWARASRSATGSPHRASWRSTSGARASCG